MPEHRFQSRRATKALIGIGAGLLFACTSAIVVFFTWAPRKPNPTALLSLLALPLAIWGCGNYAKWKGQSSGLSHSLFVISFFLGGFITRGRMIRFTGFIFLFVVLLPMVVLWSLPNRIRRRSRSRVGAPESKGA